MTLLHLIVILFLIGLGYWLLNKYGAEVVGAPILKIMNIVLIVAAVLIAVNFFIPLDGIWSWSPRGR